MAKEEKIIVEAEEVKEEGTENESTEAKAEEAKEEKKDNKFKAFFKGVKKSIDDSVLEGKIVNTYNKSKDDLNIYSYDASFGKAYCGNIEDLEVVVFGEEEIKAYSVLVHEKSEKAYYVKGTEKTTVTVKVDDVEYERPGTKIFLDPEVEEVKVVKAGKRYFLYKGEEK